MDGDDEACVRMAARRAGREDRAEALQGRYLLRHFCKSGVEASCLEALQASLRAARGKMSAAVKVDPAVRDGAERLCRAREGPACTALGQLAMSRGAEGEALNHFRAGCAAGDSAACSAVGELAEAHEAWVRACELGDPEACLKAGRTASGADRVRLWARACRGGIVEGCTAAQEGRCEAGDVETCRALDPQPLSNKARKARYERLWAACRRDRGPVCAAAYRHLVEGRLAPSGPIDDDEHAEILERILAPGCQEGAGNPVTCAALSEALSRRTAYHGQMAHEQPLIERHLAVDLTLCRRRDLDVDSRAAACWRAARHGEPGLAVVDARVRGGSTADALREEACALDQDLCPRRKEQEQAELAIALDHGYLDRARELIDRGLEATGLDERELKDLLVRCRAGSDPWACLALGRRYRFPHVGDQSSAARWAFARACEGGIGEGCLELGDHRAEHAPLEPEDALHAYREGCRLKETRSCEQARILGDEYKACRARVAKCGPWAERFVTFDNADRDAARRGAHLGMRTCRAGDQAACERWAERIWNSAVDVAPRALARLCFDADGWACRRSLTLKTQLHACDERGDPQACFEAGQSLILEEGGEGLRPSTERRPSWVRQGRERLQRACEADHAQACAELGEHWLLVDVGGPQSDRNRLALEPIERGCLLKNAEACGWLARMRFERVAGVERAPRAAVSAARRGCKRRDPAACFVLGRALEAGEGVGENPDRANRAFLRACKLGSEKACGRLGR